MKNVQSDRTGALFADRTLADIATTLPGATAVFRSEKLNFCCGGRVLLREAAAAKAKDLGEIVAKLESLVATAASAVAPQGVDALITLIEIRYHQAHRRELPELIRLARARGGGPPRRGLGAVRACRSARAGRRRTRKPHAEGGTDFSSDNAARRPCGDWRTDRQNDEGARRPWRAPSRHRGADQRLRSARRGLHDLARAIHGNTQVRRRSGRTYSH